MAVHITLYLDEQIAAELRRHMAEHGCTATEAVERLLAHTEGAGHSPAFGARTTGEAALAVA